MQLKRKRDEEQAATAELRASRRAALNLMEDAVAARRQAEQANSHLRASGEQLRALPQRLTYHVDNSPLAVIEWGPDMHIARWSGAAERIFGWKAEEVLGKRMDEFRWICQEDQAHVAEVSDDLTTGTNPRRFSANRNYRKDGSVIHCEWYNSSLADDSGKLRSILSLVLDVTERKQAEEAQRLSEEKFAKAFAGNPAALALTRLEDGLFLEVNDSWTAMNGFSREEAIGLFARKMNIWPSAEAAARFVQELREKGSLRGWEQQFRKKSGETFVAEMSAQLLTMRGEQVILTTLVDITARKRAESVLQTTLQRFYSVLSSMYSAVLLVTDEGRVEFANQAFCDCYGLPDAPADLAGITSRDTMEKIKKAYLHPDEAIARIREILERGEPVKVEELALRDGGTCLRDFVPLIVDGKSYGRLWIHTDITDRKRAEEALRDSERRERERAEELAVLLESVPTAVFIAHDPDCLHIEGNRLADEILRIPRGEELSLSAPAETKPGHFRTLKDGRELRLDELPAQRAARGEHVKDFEITLAFDDGMVRHVLGYGTPLLDGQGRPRGCVAALVDITERKRAEEALRQSLERLDMALISSKMATFDWDIVKDKRTWSDGVHGLLGTKPEHFTGAAEEFFRVMPPEDRTAVQAALVRAIETTIYETEYRAIWPDGSIHHIAARGKVRRDDAGRAVSMTGVCWDITERMQAEEAVRESEKRYRSLFDTLIEGFCIIEVIFDSDGKPVDYRFLEINPAFEAQTGLHDAQGRLMRDLAPEHEAHWFEIYGKVALTGQSARFVNEARALNRWFDVSAYRVGGPESRKVAILFNDITERFRAETALREMNLSLEQRVAERTAEVQQQADQLRALAVELSQAEQRERKRLSAILHDHIQQLLVAAQLQLGLVERANSRTVRSVVQGINSTIAEAITASRWLTVELSPPILHQSGLTAALTWLAARKEEKYLFKVHVRANSDAEPADPDVRAMLFESVRELLLNAVKHSGVREAQLIMRRTKEDWTQIIVEDKGKGFDPSAISAHRGGGFGLFSIQQRLAYLGGRLEVDSAPGRGARFVLTIPIGQAAGTEAASAAATAPPSEIAPVRPKSRKISVLLVDDHRIVRQGLASLLEFEEDIEVVGEAENGRQAVELARQHTPEVVIMDVNMPIMGGIEATQILSRELPQIKVIGLSMHAERDTAEAMRQAGAVAYLTKGGPSEDLIAAIRACRG